MKSPNLSKEAIHFLEENGYSFKSKDRKIIFKRRVAYMGAIVLLFVTLFLSIPVFAAGAIYGVVLIGSVLGAIMIRRIYFTKKSKLILDLESMTFTAIIDTYHQEDQSLKMVSTITLESKFVDEYTTAARNSVEEYLILIKIHLITKEEVVLFRLKSEQSEPTPEISELYSFLEEVVKSSKTSH